MKPNSTMTKTANTPATASAHRKVFERMTWARSTGFRPADFPLNVSGGALLAFIWSLWSGSENEAGPAHIVDHGRFARPVHLVAQLAHMHVNQIRRWNEFIVPDFLQKH